MKEISELDIRRKLGCKVLSKKEIADIADTITPPPMS
jgi:hypothetical protein